MGDDYSIGGELGFEGLGGGRIELSVPVIDPMGVHESPPMTTVLTAGESLHLLWAVFASFMWHNYVALAVACLPFVAAFLVSVGVLR